MFKYLSAGYYQKIKEARERHHGLPEEEKTKSNIIDINTINISKKVKERG